MLLKLLLLVTWTLGSCLAEAPYYNNQAPYAAAGFRPSIPFDLPNENYPSYDIDAEQQLPNQGISFEITKQRVDFAGQEIQRVQVSEPQKQYLPSEQLIFINNQLGFGNQMPKDLNHRHNHNHGRRNGNRYPSGRPGRRPSQRPTQTPPTDQTPSTEQNTPTQQTPQIPQFLPGLPPINIPQPKPNTDEKFESQQRPSFEYGPPNYNIDPRNSRQQQPASQYGAPINTDNSNNFGQQQPQQPALEYGAPANLQSNNEEELEKQYALDVLNAAVQNYNRLQENANEQIAQGQYFVVNPDHSIQRVKFTTKKSEDETKQNDFTAELKYTKVGEINDPLYKYTAEGQLVRIVKK